MRHQLFLGVEDVPVSSVVSGSDPGLIRELFLWGGEAAPSCWGGFGKDKIPISWRCLEFLSRSQVRFGIKSQADWGYQPQHEAGLLLLQFLAF